MIYYNKTLWYVGGVRSEVKTRIKADEECHHSDWFGFEHAKCIDTNANVTLLVWCFGFRAIKILFSEVLIEPKELLKLNDEDCFAWVFKHLPVNVIIESFEYWKNTEIECALDNYKDSLRRTLGL